jgi:hypothetical protein
MKNVEQFMFQLEGLIRLCFQMVMDSFGLVSKEGLLVWLEKTQEKVEIKFVKLS